MKRRRTSPKDDDKMKNKEPDRYECLFDRSLKVSIWPVSCNSDVFVSVFNQHISTVERITRMFAVPFFLRFTFDIIDLHHCSVLVLVDKPQLNPVADKLTDFYFLQTPICYCFLRHSHKLEDTESFLIFFFLQFQIQITK